MAVIQVKTRDIVYPFPQAGAVDLVIKWNKAFTDSSGPVGVGELRTPLLQIQGNRWRIPNLNLWTSFDAVNDPGVLYYARLESGGRYYDWPELQQFKIEMPGPVTSYDEIISAERVIERGGPSLGDPINLTQSVRAANDTIFVIGENYDPAITPIMLKFGKGKRAPFLRYADGTIYQSVDGLTQTAVGSGGGGGGGLTAELPVRSINANGTLAPSADGLLLINTAAGPVAVTVNNPTAGQRNCFYIKKTTTDENAITLTPASGQIDGSASYVFSGAQTTTGDGIIIIFDGTNWHVFPS